MIIVGELINASRKAVKNAIENRDDKFIAMLAIDQHKAGADYIDVNAGIFEDKESEYLCWLVEVVQSSVEAPCALDSPDPIAIEAAMKVHKGQPLINSISLEKQRWDSLLPIVVDSDCKVVALCMSDDGMPSKKEERLAIAEKMIDGLTSKSIKLENIFIDPLVQPLSVDTTFGLEFLNAVEAIMDLWPGVHSMCGLSNISYGLPRRQLLNHIFMTLAIGKGLDGAIINPLDLQMMASITATEALVGKDEFCLNYIRYYRELSES